jgi:hypothetical protein
MITRSPASYKSNGRAGVDHLLDLGPNQIYLLLMLSVFVGLMLSIVLADGDIWVAIACGLFVAIFVHLCLLADRYVAFPGFISFAASIELLLAPVVASKFPPTSYQFRMAVPLDTYLQYATPATAALWIGLHWPLNHLLPSTSESSQPAPLLPRQRKWLDIVLVVSVLLNSFANDSPAQFFFLVTILGSLGFFAALCWMLTRTPGWQFRVAIVMLQLIAIASAAGIFYLVLQWSGFFLLAYGFRSRWRSRLALTLIFATVGAGILQYVKSDYRYYIGTRDAGFIERVSTLGRMVWNKTTMEDEQFDQTRFGDVLVRFDQGWIISRIMSVVPRKVPYAEGATIKDALMFTLLPRVLFPDKPEGSSRILFARFTGLQLNSRTTMGLSIPGEMYANFGYWGGVLATFVFGSLVGLVYRQFAKLSRRSPLWWAAVPVVLLAAIEPAWNVEDISNYIVKSALVLFLFASSVPALRDLLALRPLWIWRRKERPRSIGMLNKQTGFDPRRT